MFRFLSQYIPLLLGLSSLLSANDLFEAMQKYEGRWVGHFTIHSTATGYTETFPVEQQYWLAGERLQGVAVLQRASGMESARSETFIINDKLVSEIVRGEAVEKTERYLGVLHENGVLWLPEDMQRANDHQMKETITIENGEMYLKTEGYDTYVYKDGLGHITFRGSLKFEK